MFYLASSFHSFIFSPRWTTSLSFPHPSLNSVVTKLCLVPSGAILPSFPRLIAVRDEGTDQLLGIQCVFRNSPQGPILLLCSSDQLRPATIHPPAGQPRARRLERQARAVSVAIPTDSQVAFSVALAPTQAPCHWQQASGPRCPSKPGREAVCGKYFTFSLHVWSGIVLTSEDIDIRLLLLRVAFYHWYIFATKVSWRVTVSRLWKTIEKLYNLLWLWISCLRQHQFGSYV